MNFNLQKWLRGLDRLGKLRPRVACAVFFVVVAGASVRQCAGHADRFGQSNRTVVLRRAAIGTLER
jgi:hypothetical protein